MHADALNAEFGIAGVLVFAENGHGLVKAAVSLEGAAGEVYLQGAHVTGFQPAGERPVLFLSPNSAFAPGKAIRGGIPLILPWFGAHRSEPQAPQHGFARTAPWRLEAVEHEANRALTLSFALTEAEATSPFWPHRYAARYDVTFGAALELRLALENRARQRVALEVALHSYFAVSDIAEAAVSGLGGTAYIDKPDAMRRKPQTDPIVTITTETDRVYLDTPPRCVIEDRAWRRNIVIEKEGAASTVVWNPWAEKGAALADLGDPAWRGMVCVETGNIADNEVCLAPAAEHVMTMTVALTS